jgi:hypothetical protein
MAKDSGIKKVLREFISEEKRNYKLRLGNIMASSLTGFTCGTISASIIWYIAFKYISSI